MTSIISESKRLGLRWIAIGIIAVWIAGCAGSRRANSRSNWSAQTQGSTPPTFLVGVPGLLLTNLASFSAHVVWQTQSNTLPPVKIAGELLVRGGRMLYAPAGGSDFSFIWDTATRRGFVMNEALQGYAPIASDIRITAINFAPAGSLAPARMNGFSCRPVRAQATLVDGSHSAFVAWQAAELKYLPVRIESADDPASFTLELTRIRQEMPSEELFSPPASFTKYASADAMLNELFARQHPVRKSEPLESLPPDLRQVPDRRGPAY